MRISDWSSDVCSSDLGGGKGEDRQGTPYGHVISPVMSHCFGGWRLARARRPAPQQRPGQGNYGAGRADYKTRRMRLSSQSPWNRRLHGVPPRLPLLLRSEEHTSELQSLMRISYAVFCLKKKTLE